MMVLYRSHNPVWSHSPGPVFSLFDRHRWHGECKNGTLPDICKCLLVCGLSTPNEYHVASAWPNGLAFSCRERAQRSRQKRHDLAREAVNCNAVLAGTLIS
jgi:hypothetical protein